MSANQPLGGTPQWREFYIKFSPDGSGSTSVIPTSADINQIGPFLKMRFKSITIPITFYAISSINNTVLLEEDNSGTWNTVTLTPGNYTATEFATEIKTQFETIGAGTYTVTVSTITGKITIVVAGGAATFSVSFETSNRQKEKIWGVPADTAGNSDPPVNPPANAQINDTPAASYTSTNPIMIWGPDILSVTSPQLASTISRKHTDIVDDVENILYKVPVTVTPFSQMTYIDIESELFTINRNIPVDVLGFRLDVKDEEGNSLDFNGGYIHLVVSVA